MSLASVIRDRLRHPLRLAERGRVPWHDVDVDGNGDPLHPAAEPPAEPDATFWTAPDGSRVWVHGES